MNNINSPNENVEMNIKRTFNIDITRLDTRVQRIWIYPNRKTPLFVWCKLVFLPGFIFHKYCVYDRNNSLHEYYGYIRNTSIMWKFHGKVVKTVLLFYYCENRKLVMSLWYTEVIHNFLTLLCSSPMQFCIKSSGNCIFSTYLSKILAWD